MEECDTIDSVTQPRREWTIKHDGRTENVLNGILSVLYERSQGSRSHWMGGPAALTPLIQTDRSILVHFSFSTAQWFVLYAVAMSSERPCKIIAIWPIVIAIVCRIWMKQQNCTTATGDTMLYLWCSHGQMGMIYPSQLVALIYITICGQSIYYAIA